MKEVKLRGRLNGGKSFVEPGCVVLGALDLDLDGINRPCGFQPGRLCHP